MAQITWEKEMVMEVREADHPVRPSELPPELPIFGRFAAQAALLSGVHELEPAVGPEDRERS